MSRAASTRRSAACHGGNQLPVHEPTQQSSAAVLCSCGGRHELTPLIPGLDPSSRLHIYLRGTAGNGIKPSLPPHRPQLNSSACCTPAASVADSQRHSNIQPAAPRVKRDADQQPAQDGTTSSITTTLQLALQPVASSIPSDHEDQDASCSIITEAETAEIAQKAATAAKATPLTAESPADLPHLVPAQPELSAGVKATEAAAVEAAVITAVTTTSSADLPPLVPAQPKLSTGAEETEAATAAADVTSAVTTTSPAELPHFAPAQPKLSTGSEEAEVATAEPPVTAAVITTSPASLAPLVPAQPKLSTGAEDTEVAAAAAAVTSALTTTAPPDLSQHDLAHLSHDMDVHLTQEHQLTAAPHMVAAAAGKAPQAAEILADFPEQQKSVCLEQIAEAPATVVAMTAVGTAIVAEATSEHENGGPVVKFGDANSIRDRDCRSAAGSQLTEAAKLMTFAEITMPLAADQPVDLPERNPAQGNQDACCVLSNGDEAQLAAAAAESTLTLVSPVASPEYEIPQMSTADNCQLSAGVQPTEAAGTAVSVTETAGCSVDAPQHDPAQTSQDVECQLVTTTQLTVVAEGVSAASAAAAPEPPAAETPAAVLKGDVAEPHMDLSHDAKLAAVYALLGSEIKITLQQLLEAAWLEEPIKPAARLAELNAAAAAAVPHLLAISPAAIQQTLCLEGLWQTLPVGKVLQAAAAAYLRKSRPGFFKHLTDAAAEARASRQSGMHMGVNLDDFSANFISFEPDKPLTAGTAVEVLAAASQPLRRDLISKIQAQRVPAIQGLALKKALWAVHYIAPEQDQIIRLMLQQGQNGIPDQGVCMLRQLAAQYMSDVSAYADEMECFDGTAKSRKRGKKR